MPGADPDIVAPLAKRLGKRYEKILLRTKVTAVKAEAEGIVVSYEGAEGAEDRDFRRDAGLGRAPAERQADRCRGRRGRRRRARLHRGRQADAHQRRSTSSRSATSWGSRCWRTRRRTRARSPRKSRAARSRRSTRASFRRSPTPIRRSPGSASPRRRPRRRASKFGKAVFPWAASGRSLSLGRDEGLTKTLWDEETQRLIGCGIVGPNAGDLISEVALAIEMGARSRGHRPHHPSAPDAVRDLRHVGRGLRRDADGLVYAKEEVGRRPPRRNRNRRATR